MTMSAQQVLELGLTHTPAVGTKLVSYNPRTRSAATFKSGLQEPIHRWFRLTPSFAPELVRQMLIETRTTKSELVLDPFAGASTTLIEAQLGGHNTLGFEINPVLHFVGHTSLNWTCSSRLILDAYTQVLDSFQHLVSNVTFETLNERGYVIPPIHNPLRWWRKDVLLELLVMKRAINECNCSAEVRKLLRLALAGALVPDLTNVTLGRLQLHFIDRTSDEMNVVSTVTRKVEEIAADLAQVELMGVPTRGTLLHQDATQLDGLKLAKPVNVVITSPPYPNRYSYVWNTRPHLYFLDFFSVPKEASDLDRKTIGGTWGTATSMLQKGIVHPSHKAVAKLIGPIAADIRKHDNLMANYLMRYFNLMAAQIAALTPHLASDARLAYVVGCSRLKGVYVETDVLLGELFEELELGFRLSRVERIRKRNSGKDLHESIVYVNRG